MFIYNRACVLCALFEEKKDGKNGQKSEKGKTPQQLNTFQKLCVQTTAWGRFLWINILFYTHHVLSHIYLHSICYVLIFYLIECDGFSAILLLNWMYTILLYSHFYVELFIAQMK